MYVRLVLRTGGRRVEGWRSSPEKSRDWAAKFVRTFLSTSFLEVGHGV